MAATLKKPSREKEEAREGDMSLSPHPLCVHDALPSRKQNRESRVKNACNSNSHSNIAPSNDKRPLFVQIPATSSASLVSTSLPVQYLRPSNFFFCRGIFPNSFLRHQILMTREQTLITQFAFYLVHELTNLSDYPRPFSGHKEAPSGFAYFCTHESKSIIDSWI